MSIKYMNEAWDMPLNSAEKIVLLAISDCANNEGFAYPGYNTLAQKTGMAKATLSKCLKILKGVGILKVESHSEIGKGKTVNTYTISLRSELPINSDRELIEIIKELRKIHASTISSTLELRKVQPLNPISSTPEHETPLEPPVKQPPVNNNRKLGADFLLLLEYGIDGELAQDFVVFRKGKKAAITKTAMNGFQREADKAGILIEEAVRISIERNWQGFNADWYANRPAQQNKPKQSRMSLAGIDYNEGVNEDGSF